MKLKVLEAIQDDVNKGIARIDENQMKQLGLKAGDIIEIEGDIKTYCIVDRSYPGDVGLYIVRIDGITRHNAKTLIGELVHVRKAETKEAKRIVIAPAGKGIRVTAPSGIFKQALLGRVLTKGDLVSIGGTQSRRKVKSDSLFGDIFNILNDELIGGIGFSDLKFMVIDSDPEDGGITVTENTEVVFEPEEKHEAEPEAKVLRTKTGGDTTVITFPDAFPNGWLRFHEKTGVVELDREILAKLIGVKPDEIKDAKVV